MQSHITIFTSSYRHRLFRKLFNGLYTSTDNKRSGKTSVLFLTPLLFYQSPHALTCHLLSICCLVLVSLSPISSLLLLFSHLSLTMCRSHMYIQTPVQFSVSSATLSSHSLFWSHGETDRHTHSLTHILTQCSTSRLCLSLAVLPCPVLSKHLNSVKSFVPSTTHTNHPEFTYCAIQTQT